MDIINILIALMSGAVGGNVAGTNMLEKNLGTLGNTIVGLLGGGLGDWILKVLGVLATATTTSATGAGATGSELDIPSILATIGASGVSGAH